jgi:hypothetical protein
VQTAAHTAFFQKMIRDVIDLGESQSAVLFENFCEGTDWECFLSEI